MKKFLRNAISAASAVALLAALSFAAPTARAQGPVPSVPGPYNIDLGQVLAFANLIASTANSPTGSAYTATPVNLAYRGLVCRLTETGESGSPTVAWGIQQYDAASASWTTAVAASGSNAFANQVIEMRAGVAVSGLQSGWTAINLVVPRVWRVYVTTTGASLGLTGYVGCNFTQ